MTVSSLLCSPHTTLVANFIVKPTPHTTPHVFITAILHRAERDFFIDNLLVRVLHID